MTKLHQLMQHGQSIWYDNIRRALLDNGELQALLDDGVVGVTSNPSIFEKAIAGSADYDDAIADLVTEGQSAEQIYESLAVDDIRRAADMLRPIYARTDGVDGYVSLEVSPRLAHETEQTIAEARRLFAALDRPNVMIKVPATTAGIPAIRTLIGEGINVNVTLIFALGSYEAVAEAYIAGLEHYAAGGGEVSQVASVASFFISRVDAAVDAALDEMGTQDTFDKLSTSLKGKIGIANAKVAYARFQQIFEGERWRKLADQGARVQRPLWASTSTKDPAYPETLYLDSLIGPDTVNTVPPATLNAFLEQGTVATTLTEDVNEARSQLQKLAHLGIELDAITQQILDEGVDKFAASFDSLMESVAEKKAKLQEDWHALQTDLGDQQQAVDDALIKMRDDAIVRRIWQHDHTVWQPDPEEITNRLGWLLSPETMEGQIERLHDFADSLESEGYTDVLLLGMGGSSLAPEVFSEVFGEQADGLRLAVLDSTDPAAVLAQERRLDVSKTLFIVATKSGGTAETLSFFKYFYNRVAETLGREKAGEHFVAITDPGSKLVEIAKTYNFRQTFVNDPDIGGRYSALSYFGLVPAALVGVDLARLLKQAQQEACNADPGNCPVGGNNRSARLGATLGELARAGRDKVTIIASPPIASFGDWVEQLIAESLGKSGRGIVPVVGEPVGEPDVYSDDRLFIYLRLADDDTHDEAVTSLSEAGHPLITLNLKDRYDLGSQFFLWEMATAIAGYRIDVQPFNQPNVETAKVLTRQMVDEYQKSGELPTGETAPLGTGVLDTFLAQAEPGDYIAIHAYIQPTPETDAALQSLRAGLRERSGLATTVGYGPRFLHSTGQLHKGDGGNGLFIQFVSNTEEDVAIPDDAGADASNITFGVLKQAQALGDAQALRDMGRRLIRFSLGADAPAGLEQLAVGVTA